ncbi:MAG: hypothetical protein ACRD8A_12775 [Candidatus Acidiferrales bacterium]
MPAYKTLAIPPSILPGDSVQLMNGSEPAAALQAGNYATERVALATQNGRSGSFVRVRGTFSGAPGAFSFSMQESETDSTNDFVSIGTAITAVDSNNQFYADLINAAVGPFLRGFVTSLTNAVTLTLQVQAQ